MRLPDAPGWCRTFADFEIYIPDDTNMLIVASQKGLLAGPDEAVLKAPELAAELAKIGIHSLRDFELPHLTGRRVGQRIGGRGDAS